MFAALALLYVLCQSVTTFDKRLIQAARAGALPPDQPMLPSAVGFLIFLQWALGAGMLLLDWKRALAAFGIVFLLQVLPVLEHVGSVLTQPLRRWGVPYSERPL